MPRRKRYLRRREKEGGVSRAEGAIHGPHRENGLPCKESINDKRMMPNESQGEFEKAGKTKGGEKILLRGYGYMSIADSFNRSR